MSNFFHRLEAEIIMAIMNKLLQKKTINKHCTEEDRDHLRLAVELKELNAYTKSPTKKN